MAQAQMLVVALALVFKQNDSTVDRHCLVL